MTGKQKHDPVTGELAVQETVAAAVVQQRDGDHISKYVKQETANVEASRAQIHASIIDEIMSATSLDDVLTMTEGQDLEDFAGRVIEIQRIAFNDSDFQEGPKVYCSLKGFDVETGEKFLINTGEQAVMAQVMKIDELAGWPYRVRPMQSSRMNNFGRFPMRLVMVKE